MDEGKEADIDIGISDAKIEQFSREVNVWLKAHREQADPQIWALRDRRWYGRVVTRA